MKRSVRAAVWPVARRGAASAAKIFAYASSYQTITVGDLPDVALAAGTVEVSATASGGGAVTVVPVVVGPRPVGVGAKLLVAAGSSLRGTPAPAPPTAPAGSPLRPFRPARLRRATRPVVEMHSLSSG